MTLRFDQWGRYFIGDGFGRQESIILLPLSPSACLAAGPRGPQIRRIPGNDLQELNKVVISSSARFVYSRTESADVDLVVQERAGTVRYGINAFTRDGADELADFFF